jgi:RNA polymerase sigma factor (sigma-70 family)
MKSSHEVNRSLLDRCFGGDRKAAETFVRQFSGLVYRSVQYILRARQVPFDKPLLEDLHNTVFLQLFERNCKKLRQFQGRNGCSLATWISLVAVRSVLNHLRKKGYDAVCRRKQPLSLDDLPELCSAEMDASAQLVKAEQELRLQEGIQNLPPQGRLLMKLHLGQGLAVEEVAAAMQISVQNAYTIKHRAIQKLKSAFQEIFNMK